MNLKKVLVGVAAALALLPCFLLGSAKGETVQAASSINDLAKQYKYVGTTYLYKMLKQQGITYNNFYNQNKITYRKGKPEGVVIHETATPGASAYNEAIYFNREWPNMYAYVHAFVDANQLIQMMTPDYGVWGAGPMANNRFVQIELCEVNNRTDFAKSVNNDAIWVAQILHRYKLKPSNATHNGKGTIWSHAAVSKFLGGTDHGDPDGYFKKWGYSMDQFVDLVKYYYNQQGSSSSTSSKTSSKTTTKTTSTSKTAKSNTKSDSKSSTKSTNKSTKTTSISSAKDVIKIPKAKKGETILMHDAIVYDAKGKRNTKVGKLKAGTSLKLNGTKTIKKRKYYQIATNQYIVASNIDGTERTLRVNSYIYNAKGVSDGKVKLVKNTQVKTYGSQVNIMSVKYYQISPSQFIKVQNF